MPSANPAKSFLTEGGAECEKVRVIHSNKLQERKSYTYEKKRPDEGNPLKFYLLNFGNSVQPGDPVILKAVITGQGFVETTEGNPDTNTYAEPGSARFVLYPPFEMGEFHSVWPCEFEVVDSLSLGYSTPGSTLRSRSQRASYNPNITDAEIEAEPGFSVSLQEWIDERFYAWKRAYGWESEVPPPEEYEITGKKNQIRESFREYYSVQWNSWDEHYITQNKVIEGTYWSGGRDSDGRTIDIPYSYDVVPLITPKLCREDGTEISGEGLDPVTLLAYEFISEPGLDIQNMDDWTEALRVNFLGTPAPLTIECDDSNCPNHCLELKDPALNAYICICSSEDLDTPIAPNPNSIERARPPGAPDPPPPTLGQRKAKARDLINKLQPQFDRAKEKYNTHGDAAESAHNLHRAQDADAKDPTKTQAERDAAAEASAAAVRDRDDEMLQANEAARAMQDTKKGLDALRDFVGQNQAEEDSGISVGVDPPKPSGWRPPLVPGDGWRPPLVNRGSGWNNTPTHINNNATTPDRGTTQTFGPSGGIQAAQVQTPQVSGGSGFQSPQVSGGGGFVPGQWNATPTSITETQDEIISEIITEE